MRTFPLLAIGTCLIFAQNPVVSQTLSGSVEPSYADLADVVPDAPVALRATIRKVTKLPPEIASRASAGRQRVLVEARVTSLIRGQGGLPRDLQYLYDAPLDAKGRVVKLPKRDVLLLGTPVAGKPNQIVLAGRKGQIDWTPGTEARLKAILSEVLGATPPPQITGIGEAFHVQGTVAGEGETQIFLKTRSGDPVSISIVRRPGQPVSWGAAVGEIVDESAGAPPRDTLLWYNLACRLPAQLPDAAVAAMGPVDVAAARADYQVVRDSVGACDRPLD